MSSISSFLLIPCYRWRGYTIGALPPRLRRGCRGGTGTGLQLREAPEWPCSWRRKVVMALATSVPLMQVPDFLCRTRSKAQGRGRTNSNEHDAYLESKVEVRGFWRHIENTMHADNGARNRSARGPAQGHVIVQERH
jgi:hypothetical protein